ncbi:MAG: prolipoprotein diacylglyceryl transferase, partial [Firmicutes bacterium]|nr:prolipoprotein diacylglyceryl transferase [Bacillota bacterium]
MQTKQVTKCVPVQQVAQDPNPWWARKSKCGGKRDIQTTRHTYKHYGHGAKGRIVLYERMDASSQGCNICKGNDMGFDLFGLWIQWYGVIISFGMLLAYLVVGRLYKKTGYDSGIVSTLALMVIPFAILGARAYFVIFYKGPIDFFAIREGGLAILGGVLMGAVVVFGYTKFKKAGAFTLSDG